MSRLKIILYHRGNRCGRESNRVPEPSLIQGHAGADPKLSSL